MAYPKIKNIIFDLGGVLIDLDFNKTYQKLADYSGIDLADLLKMGTQDGVFLDYEKGLISSEDFIEEVKMLIGKGLTNNQIIDAWNAMLLDIPVERLRFVEKLKRKYNLVVLSNTNALHVESFSRTMDEVFGVGNYHSLFNKIYYSHEVHMRKPELTIFQHVLKDSNMRPEETLYFEDNLDNISAAEELNIVAYQVPQNKIDIDFLSNELL